MVMGLIATGILKLPMFTTNPKPVMMRVDPHHREVTFHISLFVTYSLNDKIRDFKINITSQSLSQDLYVYKHVALDVQRNRSILSYTKRSKITCSSYTRRGMSKSEE